MPVFDIEILNRNGQVDPNGLLAIGPRLRVEIQLPAVLAAHLQAHNQPLPQPQTGVALIDTGASVSVVDSGAVTALGIHPVGVANIVGVTGAAPQQTYPATFLFPGSPLPRINFAAVVGANLANLGLIALLGRDVLSRCLVVYNGTRGVVTVSF